jgi:hypothetical protein
VLTVGRGCATARAAAGAAAVQEALLTSDAAGRVPFSPAAVLLRELLHKHRQKLGPVKMIAMRRQAVRAARAARGAGGRQSGPGSTTRATAATVTAAAPTRLMISSTGTPLVPHSAPSGTTSGRDTRSTISRVQQERQGREATRMLTRLGRRSAL